jgi:predicted amidophosphoribosyltransferase
VFARHLAKQNGGDITQVLQRFGQAHQVGANRVERIAHLQDALRVVKKPTIQNTHLLLVDDVLTTGATLETAARLLKKAGARQVDALVFSQPT